MMSPVEGSLHINYRRREAAKIDDENVKLANRILHQKSRDELSARIHANQWKKTAKTIQMHQATSSV